MQDLVPNSQCRTSGPLTLPTSPPTPISHGVSRRCRTRAHLRGPSSYHLHPLPCPPLYSGLPGPGSLESAGTDVFVGTAASSAEFCACQSHGLNATPPDSRKTVLPPRAPRLPRPTPFSYPSVLRPWSWRSRSEELFPLSDTVPTLWRLQHGRPGTASLYSQSPHRPYPGSLVPQVDAPPTMRFGPCADTYRVGDYMPDYLSPWDGCGLRSSWDPPGHRTTCYMITGSSSGSPL